MGLTAPADAPSPPPPLVAGEGTDEAQLWPSVGEYPVYDRFLYALMSSDRLRNRRYLAALRARVGGRVVVDIGTGRHLNWARACVEAGARLVYAIEQQDDSFEEARARVARLGLGERIRLVRGASLAAELPERADVCISEIIGLIGGSEGAAVALNDARRRFLKPGGVMIPERCVTRVAALRLPDRLAHRPRFTDAGEGYARAVFAATGRPFDVRVCVRGLPPSSLLSDAAVFEDLDFRGPAPAEHASDTRLEIARAGRLDGLLLWIDLWCGGGTEPLSSLHHETSWSPVVFPAFSPGVEVRPGDRLEFRCRRVLSSDGHHPDYAVEGALRSGGTARPFAHVSPHHDGVLHGSPFYRALLASYAQAAP